MDVLVLNMKQALIVDDAPTAVEILKRSLHGLDIQAHGVNSGEDALLYLAKADQLPDYVFMDVMMPGIDGYETTEQLLGKEKTSHLPVIIYTTLRREEDKVKATSVGAVGFLSKPFAQPALKACLQSL